MSKCGLLWANALPIDHRTVVGIEAGLVLLRFADLRTQLILIDGDSETRICRQITISVLHRRQRLCKQVGMLRIAAFLNQKVGDRRGNLKAGSQRARSLRIVRRDGQSNKPPPFRRSAGVP